MLFYYSCVSSRRRFFIKGETQDALDNTSARGNQHLNTCRWILCAASMYDGKAGLCIIIIMFLFFAIWGAAQGPKSRMKTSWPILTVYALSLAKPHCSMYLSSYEKCGQSEHVSLTLPSSRTITSTQQVYTTKHNLKE